jgi:GNAT superfamily N-acetyltransferase
MIVPDGYADIPAGKIAAVVTHLEMTKRPTLAPGAGGARTLRRMQAPDPQWFRDLYRRVGDDGRDEGLLELDFRTADQCEIVFFGVTAKLIGSGAGRRLMNRALELIWSRPVGRVWVHTCTFDHPAALAFYQRSGFRPFRRQVEVAEDPRLDGTAPRSAAPHIPIIE